MYFIYLQLSIKEGYRLFLSSTMKDLSDIRQKVQEIIIKTENIPIMAENFIGSNKVKKLIEEKIKSCDGYLGIFHEKWGYVPTDNNPDNLSVTAIECENSKIINIPRQIFVSTLEKEKPLQDYIDRISNYETGDWIKKYTDIHDLFVLVALSIPVLENEIRKKQNKANVQERIIVGFDKMEDISKDDLIFIIRYTKSEKYDLRTAAWETLEAYANTKRLWKHDEIWDLIENEIIRSDNRDTIHNAIFILKVMLWKSKKENSNYVSDHIRYHYIERLQNILSSSNENLTKSNQDIVQIIQTLYKDCERYNIFWKCWKKCAYDIKDQNIYEKIVRFFINDLEYADSKCKKLTMEELFRIMDSDNKPASSRAKDIHNLLKI